MATNTFEQFKELYSNLTVSASNADRLDDQIYSRVYRSTMRGRVGQSADLVEKRKEEQQRVQDYKEQIVDLMVEEYNNGSPSIEWSSIENFLFQNAQPVSPIKTLIKHVVEMKCRANDLTNFKETIKAAMASFVGFDSHSIGLTDNGIIEICKKFPQCIKEVEAVCLEAKHPMWLYQAANIQGINLELIGQCFNNIEINDLTIDWFEDFGKEFAKDLSPQTRTLLKAKYEQVMQDIALEEDLTEDSKLSQEQKYKDFMSLDNDGM